MNTDNALQFYSCVISPGYLGVSDDPAFLCSVCGNGVVVVIWDKMKKNGGMAHCVFPGRRWGENPSNFHADVSVPALIREMLSFNTYEGYLEAQIFGGGSLQGYSRKRAERVIAVVKRILKKARIELVAEDTGGSIGRKIMFNTLSGDAIIFKTKRIRRTDWAPEYSFRDGR